MKAFGGRPVPVRTTRIMAEYSLDDAVYFNTQSASQWDGFRHFGFRSTCQYYNGYVEKDFAWDDILSVHLWVKGGAICARGILIDFYKWATQRRETIDMNSGRGITMQEIHSILEYQGTTLRPGDIRIFRTGWLKWYKETHPADRHDELCLRNSAGTHRFVGIAQEPAFIEWIWNNQIAAVAGDQVALECTPPPDTSFGWIHEHMLGALGCPIGELWNTEEIAEVCRARKKYEFFLSSVPLCLPGGVASPSNAIATV